MGQAATKLCHIACMHELAERQDKRPELHTIAAKSTPRALFAASGRSYIAPRYDRTAIVAMIVIMRKGCHCGSPECTHMGGVLRVHRFFQRLQGLRCCAWATKPNCTRRLLSLICITVEASYQIVHVPASHTQNVPKVPIARVRPVQ